MPEPHKENVNGFEFLMLPVEGGAFRMGSDKAADPDAYDDEQPVHKVRVSDFYIGQYPVTQALWRAVLLAEVERLSHASFDPDPSFFKGDQRPVEQVSWDDAQVFLQILNDLTKSTRPAGHFYRLPTEAEWEYAARGGGSSRRTKYAGSDKLKEVGWYDANSHGETKPVGQKDPNELDIFDMSGNVYEWCEDDWHDNYNGAPADGSAWIDSPKRGAFRVNRGGGWLGGARLCRAAYRNYSPPSFRGQILGFRLVLSLQSVG